MVSLQDLAYPIQTEWFSWKARSVSVNYISFYLYLKNNRPELLNFRCNGAPERKIKEIILRVDKSIL